MSHWRAAWVSLAVTAAAAEAQQGPEIVSVGIGVSSGILMLGNGFDRPEPVVWVEFLALARRGFGVDARAGTLPRELSKENRAVMVADLGAGYAIPWGRAQARLAAGASVVTGLGGPGSSFVDPGGYVGAGLLIRAANPLHVRLSARQHLYREEGKSLFRLTFALGVMVTIPVVAAPRV